MYCSNCGKQINNENIYCTNCGAKILEAEKDLSKDTKVIKIPLKRMIAIATLIVLFVFIIVGAILFTNKTSTVPLADKPNINYNSNISDNNIIIANNKNVVNDISKNTSISNNQNTVNNNITNTSENTIDTSNNKETKEYGVWKNSTNFDNDYQQSLWEKFEVKSIAYSERHFIEIPTVSKYPNLNKELQKLKNEVTKYVQNNSDKYSCYVVTYIFGYADDDNLYDIRIARSLTEKRDVGFAKTASYELKYDIEKDYIIYVKNFDGVITVDTPIENGILQY